MPKESKSLGDNFGVKVLLDVWVVAGRNDAALIEVRTDFLNTFGERSVSFIGLGPRSRL